MSKAGDITVEARGGACTIGLAGALTIEMRTPLREVLLKELAGCETLRLRMKDVTKVDLAFIELLCSATLTALGMQKAISMQGPMPEVLAEALARAGYARPRGCKNICDARCMWVRAADGSEEKT
ncbi:MAG: STAS domain-containing protein [Nitrospirota bacterium]|jgi:ABC-type transporter Mla MlaB component